MCDTSRFGEVKKSLSKLRCKGPGRAQAAYWRVSEGEEDTAFLLKRRACAKAEQPEGTKRVWGPPGVRSGYNIADVGAAVRG